MTPRLAITIWLAGLIVWAIIRYRFERKAKKIPVSVSLFDRRDKLSLILAWIGLLLCPCLWVLTDFPALFDRHFVPDLAWLGGVTDCVALWLFNRSHADLGTNWSVTLEIRQKHTLINTGAYQFVRHPMYSSFFLLGIAQLFLLSNWFAGVTGLVGVGILFFTRVNREEKMMLERFGEIYQTYISNTKRLIPYIF
jgi:protein-S-isoprenylcysteine O-methyltransferase Ste14